MPTLTIDGKRVEVAPGATVLEAAARAGVLIPTMCYREGYPANTSCMVCVVKIEGRARLLPACGTRAEEGMVVESETEEVHAARRMALELLLADHLGDCLGPCEVVCPAHLETPAMIRHLAAGEVQAAAQVARRRLALPATLGYVCAAMCQRACRRAAADGAVEIRALHRYVGEASLAGPEGNQWETAPSSGKRVAIIGAGPTGLAAAYYLSRAGHACVLFEADSALGGGLRHCVREGTLPSEVLEAEIRLALGEELDIRRGDRVDLAALSALEREYDAVLLACGILSEDQAAAAGLPWERHGIAVTEHGQVVGRPGLFAAGAAVSPSRHAARACGEGRLAAEAIGRFLSGEREAPPPVNTRMGRLEEAELATLLREASPEPPVRPSGEGGGFTSAEALREARRCLQCECAKLAECRLRRLATEYHASPSRFRYERRRFWRDSSHPQVVYEPGKCIACGLCLQITERAGEPLGLAFVGRGFSVRTAVPFHESLAAGLQRSAAECVAACPTGALAWKATAEGQPAPPEPLVCPSSNEQLADA